MRLSSTNTHGLSSIAVHLDIHKFRDVVERVTERAVHVTAPRKHRGPAPVYRDLCHKYCFLQ